MKKLLLASTAILAMAGAASAADLPSAKGPPISPVYAPPAFTWTGFYVGLNAGYGWNSNNKHDVYGLTSSSDNGGFVGGAQIGYNYQINQFVLGAEADIQYADLKNKGGLGYDPVYNVYYGVGGGGIDWFGTVRARLGFTPTDRLLIYGTGGFAYGGGGKNNSYYGGYYTSSGSDTKTGWTLGGGVEYAFTPNLTARLEGLYVNLGKVNESVAYYNNKKDLEFGVVRAALNYKFDWGVASPFARY